MSRFMSFYQSLSKSENSCTHLYYLLCNTSRTPVSINRRLLLSKLNEDEYGECSVMNKQFLRSVYENKEKCVANGVLLKELCLLMDRILTTHLSRSDICHLIDFIFTG
jgi:dTDP-4-amino-4,6-dideoxygalactose transaminase